MRLALFFVAVAMISYFFIYAARSRTIKVLSKKAKRLLVVGGIALIAVVVVLFFNLNFNGRIL